MSFRFIHISDLHLPPLPAPRPAQIANKRLLGYLSWHRKRKYRHRQEVVTALEKDLAGQGADHICITGDITNLGLPAEFDAARRWLGARGARDAITFVPGNHDAYVPASIAAMNERLLPWMPEAFPLVHRRGDVVFIGLNTAVATPPFLATGRLGAEQLARLKSTLDENAAQDTYKVLLLHHPPAAGILRRRKALTDAAELGALLRDRPVDLILHGHGHRAAHYEVSVAGGAIPVFGAGSASLSHEQPAHSGHYHVFDLSDRELRVTHRRYLSGRRRFEAESTASLTRGGHPARLAMRTAPGA